MGRAEELFDRISKQGVEAIDALISDRQSEELFLDFKRSADDGAGTKLHQNDRQNLAKAISGFGNSEGGIILWGIDCRNKPSIGDVAQAQAPIHNPKQFKSWLEGAISGCTVPAHKGVRHQEIELAPEKGFVITQVPMSFLAPHQCLHDLRYYMRAGSDFSPVPHAVLAGMFGRRPQAHLIHNWLAEVPRFDARPPDDPAVRFIINLTLHNLGPGIARDLYVNLETWAPGRNGRVTGHVTSNNWTQEQVLDVSLSAMSHESFRLGPNGVISPMSLTFELVGPFERALTYKLSYGCSDSTITYIERTVEPVALLRIVRAQTTHEAGRLIRDALVAVP